MTKRLVREFITFGKGDGEELRDEYVFEDNAENREELLDEFGSYDFALDNEQEFIDGKIDGFQVEMSGGDWDDPTGKSIVIYDKQELIDEVTSKYEREIDEIERLFKESD